MKSKFYYVGIRVKDLEKSVDFYTKLLGMKVKGRTKIEQTKGENVRLETEEGGFLLELNYYPTDSPILCGIRGRRGIGSPSLQR
jgi:catechol 2,3-dioxygenase-like lactoylglutathione lyase family enzyme